MRSVHLVTFLLFVAGASAAQAQPPEAFRSFSVMAPTISDEIVVMRSMETPEGSYRVTDRRSFPQEHVFQVEGCVRHPLETGGARNQRYLRCRVVEITRSLECASCTPHAITFENVLFARYTSPVSDEAGRPVVDNWYAVLSTGLRRVRLLIEPARFIVHDWGVSDPSMAIIEAPLRRSH